MKYLSADKPSLNVGISIALLLLIGLVDYFTGYELGFFVFYFIPIAISAWYVSRSWAILISIASAITWFLVDLISDKQYSWWFFRYWDTGIRLLSFLIIAITLSKIKILIDKETKLNVALSKALGEVNQLRGLLPICASCKRIRNDKGYWEQIEVYIGNHSAVEFSHGLCPECLKKLYPDLYDEEEAI
jgi:hypothetical protein